MIAVVWILFMLSSIKADMPVFVQGSCPQVTGISDFQEDYLGQWFQLAALPAFFASNADACVWAKYSPSGSGPYFSVKNSGISSTTNLRYEIDGSAIVTGDLGEVNVAFFGPPNAGEPNYYVLDTDYTEFAYVWNCENFYFSHVPYLWILNRGFNYTEEYVNEQQQKATDILVQKFRYTPSRAASIIANMYKTDHSNCDY